MQQLQGFWKSTIGKIVILGGGGFTALIFLCIFCSVIGALTGDSKSESDQAERSPTLKIVSLEESESEPANTPEPEPAPQENPTNTPAPAAPAIGFSEFVQHPDVNGWTSTQYNSYFDTIKGQTVTGSGTVIEIKEFGGEPYISLNINPEEPVIDAYIYISDDEILKAGLGQNVEFSGTIDSNWPEDNGFYSLQIRNATIEFGEIPPTPTTAPTDTPAPTNTPTTAPTPIPGYTNAGTHLVGSDIQPGIYVGLAGVGLLDSCYWARLSNLSGSDDIIANDNAEGLYYLEVRAGDVALETACDLIPIESAPASGEFLTVLTPGTYIIGRDIEAGLFRGQAGDDFLNSCYWARLSNVSGSDDIIANDNATGQFFIEVQPGDFALKVGCDVEK